jgi:murein DD-endopeptidase MepM/ murein hydrolase activator NlpD
MDGTGGNASAAGTGTDKPPGRPWRRFGIAALGVWAVLASGTAVGVWVTSGGAMRDIETSATLWEARIAETAAERDTAISARLLAEARLDAAMKRVADGEGLLMRADEARRANAASLEAVRTQLGDAVRVRDLARRDATSLEGELALVKGSLTHRHDTAAELAETLGSISLALAETTGRREAAEIAARALADRVAELEAHAKLDAQRMERLLGRIEDAATVSLGALSARIAPTGFDVDRLIAEIRDSYSGEGGPLVEVSATMELGEDDPQSARLTALLGDLERLQLLNIAAAKLPLALPVKDAFRTTSLFGARRSRLHEGIDLAATKGTPIYATADGEVIFASRQRGYGNVIKISHTFGVETVYAHLSAIRVKVGDRVALGDRIGDMGNTGRSTGTHLHYEIRVNGTAVNPLNYMKAARDVL